MALPSNDPKQGNAASILSRVYADAEVLDGALHYQFITTNATATEIFLEYPRTAGLTINSVVEVTEQTRLYVPPSSMVYIEGTALGMRIDTAAKAVHHASKFEYLLFRPTTGNMVESGNLVTASTVTAGAITFAAASPGWQTIVGTQSHVVFDFNAAGYVTCTVTGAASQTIKWEVTIDKLRSVSD